MLYVERNHQQVFGTLFLIGFKKFFLNYDKMAKKCVLNFHYSAAHCAEIEFEKLIDTRIMRRKLKK